MMLLKIIIIYAGIFVLVFSVLLGGPEFGNWAVSALGVIGLLTAVCIANS